MRRHFALFAAIILLLGIRESALSQSKPVDTIPRQKIAEINKKVVGKWWCCDQKSYLEFFPDGACSEGAFYDGTWHIEKAELWAWERGKEFICVSGALTLIAPNTLTRDIGMGGVITRYYRGFQQPKPTVSPAVCTLCGVWEYTGMGRSII